MYIGSSNTGVAFGVCNGENPELFISPLPGSTSVTLRVEGNIAVADGYHIVGVGNSDVVPSRHAAFDVGKPDQRWRDGHFARTLASAELKVEGAAGAGPVAEFWSGPSVAAVIADGGSVGIGTTQPRSALDVVGDVLVAGHILPSSDRTYDLGVPTARFRDLYITSNTIYVDEYGVSINNETGALQVVQVDPEYVLGSNSRVSILSAAQQVGVGTDAPVYGLDVRDVDFAHTQNGMSVVRIAVGDLHVYKPGSNELRFAVGWTNAADSPTQLLRVDVTCDMAGSNVRAFRRFQTLVDAHGDMDADVDISSCSDGTVEFGAHCVERAAPQSVDICVPWTQ